MAFWMGACVSFLDLFSLVVPCFRHDFKTNHRVAPRQPCTCERKGVNQAEGETGIVDSEDSPRKLCTAATDDIEVKRCQHVTNN